MAKKNIQDLIVRLEDNMSKVVFGKKRVIRDCLAAFFAGGHVLLEDVPGVGKTLLARALAKSLSGEFRRIQFTPDLLPADITGGSTYKMKTQEFEFVRGPIFANIVLADEINRTTPRTQSAMLEAMSERQVSIDGNSYALPEPFMVLATENPMEFEGTFPLPESQLDRFLIRISVGYPDRASELDILHCHQFGNPIDSLEPVLTCDDILFIQREVQKVRISGDIHRYILDIVDATRNCKELHVGVSIRGAIAFSRAVQAIALIDGRDFVIPDDVKHLAVTVLSHRVMMKNVGHGNLRETAETIIEQLLNTVPIPV